MSILIHIPHSSVHIPDTSKYIVDPMPEIQLLTDWATDSIFDIPNIPKVVFPYSRVFCDVERFLEGEPMEKKGMGFYYTHTDDGRRMRENDPIEKNKIRDEYYIPHHQKLYNATKKLREQNGHVLIIDGHSFTDTPFQRDISQNKNRPDICLGSDEFHTPTNILKQLKKFFENQGFSVLINNPYAGCIIPIEYYQKDKNVMGIMIEINRKLYMENGIVIPEKIQKLNEILQKIPDIIMKE